LRKNKILRLLFQFHSEYSGNSYVSGNAVRHALKIHEKVKFGIFTNKRKLTIPETYNEFFDIRRTIPFLFPYITKIRPRGMTQTSIRHIIYFPNYLTVDIITSSSTLLKKIRDKETYQFGGQRRLGYGLSSLIDYVWINVQELEIPSTASHAVLLSPMLSIPSFFYAYPCRWDREILWNNNIKKIIKLIPSGQFFRLKSNKIESIALKGMTCNMPFGHIGFGEFVLCDWNTGGVE